MTSFSARHRLISGLIQALVGALLVVVFFKPPHGGTFDLPLWLWGRQTLLLRGRGGRYAVVAAALGLLVSVGSRYVNDLLFPPPLGRNAQPRGRYCRSLRSKPSKISCQPTAFCGFTAHLSSLLTA